MIRFDSKERPPLSQARRPGDGDVLAAWMCKARRAAGEFRRPTDLWWSRSDLDCRGDFGPANAVPP